MKGNKIYDNRGNAHNSHEKQSVKDWFENKTGAEFWPSFGFFIIFLCAIGMALVIRNKNGCHPHEPQKHEIVIFFSNGNIDTTTVFCDKIYMSGDYIYDHVTETSDKTSNCISCGWQDIACGVDYYKEL